MRRPRSRRSSANTVRRTMPAQSRSFSQRGANLRRRRFAPRCEKERDCAGIVRRTVLAELRLDRRRLIFTAACTQPFSERPLVFWKRIYLSGALQSIHSFVDPVSSKQHFSLQQERWGIIALERESKRAQFLCFFKSACLKLVEGQSRIHPRGGFGIVWAGSTHGQLHRLDRSGEIAFEPAHVGGTSISLKIGLQIHHLLISLSGVVQLPLLHQRIAQKPVIKAESSLVHEATRQRLGFFEAMQILQHVPAQ